jgi:hypothetical protein
VTDQGHLAEMASQAQQRLSAEKIDVVADMGYFDGDEVKKCVGLGITTYIAKPSTSANISHRAFLSKTSTQQYSHGQVKIN